jgi:hypothetical protein
VASSLETETYEKGWGHCDRCKCRRPLSTLRQKDAHHLCRDLGWCNRVVLWREEQKALEALPKNKKRKKSLEEM